MSRETNASNLAIVVKLGYKTISNPAMRIFRYWTKYSGTLLVGDKEQTSAVYGGSNHSMKDAVRAAKERLEKVQAKIIAGRFKDSYF